MKIGNIELPDKPVILAPMEDVTDPAFRRLCKEFGADMMYTEFISSEGLIRDAFKSTRKLDYDEMERPIGIQIFGHMKESMVRAAQVSEAAGPDLIDINYGCPVKKVVSKGAGAAFLKDVERMVEMTRAVIDTVSVPVTIKTRLGWDDNDKPIVEVARRMQDIGVAAMAVHGRTRSQGYKGEADWTLIGEIKKQSDITMPVFGNGDITSPEMALEMWERYGVDGVMIGRGAIGNPWIFKQIKDLREKGRYDVPEVEERIEVCIKHFHGSVALKGELRAVKEMRKHYGSYFKGIAHFKPFRQLLMQAGDTVEVMEVFEKIRKAFA